MIQYCKWKKTWNNLNCVTERWGTQNTQQHGIMPSYGIWKLNIEVTKTGHSLFLLRLLSKSIILIFSQEVWKHLAKMMHFKAKVLMPWKFDDLCVYIRHQNTWHLLPRLTRSICQLMYLAGWKYTLNLI